MRVAGTVLAFLLLSSVATATTMRRASFAELVRDASAIVIATPERSAAFWDGGRILTRHTLRVEETWKGAQRAELTILTLGGVVGELGQRVEGEASLPVGKRLVLFLEPHPRHDALRVVAMSQGVLLIEEPEATSAPAGTLRPAAPDLAGLPASGLAELKGRVLELVRAR